MVCTKAFFRRARLEVKIVAGLKANGYELRYCNGNIRNEGRHCELERCNCMPPG